MSFFATRDSIAQHYGGVTHHPGELPVWVILDNDGAGRSQSHFQRLMPKTKWLSLNAGRQSAVEKSERGIEKVSEDESSSENAGDMTSFDDTSSSDDST